MILFRSFEKAHIMTKDIKIILCFVVQLSILGAYSALAHNQYPLDTPRSISHSFGEYRIYSFINPLSGTNRWRHEGVDIAADVGMPVSPIDNGTAYAYDQGDVGYGKYVVVKHNGYESLYAHLIRFSESLKSLVGTGQGLPVDANAVIGYVGNTGNSDGAHLHLGTGKPITPFSASSFSQFNPLSGKLAQPKDPLNSGDSNVGKALIGPDLSNLKTNGTTKNYISFIVGTREVNGISSRRQNGQFVIDPIKVVAEAYQYTGKSDNVNYYKTNPYKVVFSVSNNNGYSASRTIQFNDMNASVEGDYMIGAPKPSKQFSEKNNFYMYWQPPGIGIYTAKVDVFPIYDGNIGTQPTDTRQRDISIGISNVDFMDNEYPVAWNPDTGAGIAAAGIAVASVPPTVQIPQYGLSSQGKNISTITLPKPNIYYVNVSSQIFTAHPDDPDFQNSTLFTARADKTCTWKVYIRDTSGNLSRVLTAPSGEDMQIVWDGFGMSGIYSYQVEAKDPFNQVSTVEGGQIIVDTIKPGFMIQPYVMPTNITATVEGTSLGFSANKDLYSVAVNIINPVTGGVIVNHLNNMPSLRSNQMVYSNWDNAGHYANGDYAFQIVMTDLAGNITTYQSQNITINIPSNEAINPEEDLPTQKPNLPDLPSQRPILSAVGLDNAENMYVLYGNEGKVKIYDKNGGLKNIVNQDGGINMRLPLGISVRPDGGSFVVADTYNNRILVFDGGGALRSVNETAFKGYLDIEKQTTYLGGLFRSSVNESTQSVDNAMPYFNVPTDVSYIPGSGNFLVLDSNNNKVLMFDGAGNPAVMYKGDYTDRAKVGGETLMTLARDIDNVPASENLGMNLWANFVHAVSGLILGIFGNEEIKSCDYYSNELYESYGFISGYNANSVVRSMGYANTYGPPPGLFLNAYAFARGLDGSFAVANTNNDRIDLIGSGGTIQGVFLSTGTGETGVKHPEGIERDEDGYIYVSDTGNNRIQRFSGDYKYVCTYGDDKLSPMPQKLVVRRIDGKKRLYYCTGGLDKVQVCDTDTPPTDFSLTIPVDCLYYINEQGLNLSWSATHESDYIKLQKYQIIGQRSDRNYWEILQDDISPETRAIKMFLPSEGDWTVNVHALNGTAYRNSDGGSDMGDISNEARQIHAVCDFTPPTVYDYFYPKYYSPLVGSFDATFKVTDAGSSELQSVNVFIYDANNNLVRFLYTDVPAACRSYDVSWNGNDENGVQAPDGKYSLVVKATDKAGNLKEETGRFIVDSVKPVISNESISTLLLTPNGAGVHDNTTISFSVSEPSDVSVQLYDSAGTMQRRFDLSSDGNSISQVVWDGKNNNGEVIEGTYEILIKATDLAGNVSKKMLADSILVSMNSYLFDVCASPEVMSQVIPNPKPITLDYYVPDTCTMEAYITDNGNNIYTLVPSQAKEKGSYTVDWNGKDDKGNNVKEGSFNYLFSATTPNKTMTKKGIVRIDNTPPYASQVKLSASDISMKELSANGLQLSYYLSEKSFATIDVIDQYGMVVSNVISGQLQAPQAQTIALNGYQFSKDGVVLTGSFTIRIHLVDEAGNELIDEFSKVNVLSGLSISNVTETPATFTPNGDNHDDFANIKYTVLGGGNNVTSKVVIKTLAGTTVKTFTENNANGTYLEVWDGRDETGTPAVDGQYQYEVSVSDSDGNGPIPVTGNVNLVRSPTIVMYADPLAFSPNGDGFMDTTKFYYTINYLGRLMEGDSHINIDILDQSGNKVYHFADTKQEGSYSQIWDASNNIVGGYVPDGTYGLQFTASDPSGTLYSYTANLVVDRGPPNILDEGVSEPIITPNGDGQQDETIIKYKVLDVGPSILSVKVRIYDSQTTFDATTLVASMDGSVNGDTVWNGHVNVKGGNGDADNNGYADKGKYKYVIESTDVLGNVRTLVSTNEIEIDKVYLSFVPPLNDPSEPYFSPNGDSIKDSTIISFLLITTQESQPTYLMSPNKSITSLKKKIQSADYCVGRVTVKVKDASGNAVKTLIGSEECFKDTTYTVTWDGTNDSGMVMPDGTYSVEVTAVDMINDPATNDIIPSCIIDTVAPSAEITSPAEYSWQSGSFEIDGCASDSIPVSYSLGYDASTNNIGTCEGNISNGCLMSWDTAGIENINKSCLVNLYVVNAAGNTAEAQRYFNIDNIPPTISNIVVKSNGQIRNNFNPYIDKNVTIEFQVDDNSYDPGQYTNPSTTSYISAEMYLSGVPIASLNNGIPGTSGLNSIAWTGLNNDGDYVNEGTYEALLIVKDAMGNATSELAAVEVRDDVQLTGLADGSFSECPDLKLNSGQLNLRFNTGDSWGDTTLSFSMVQALTACGGNSIMFINPQEQVIDVSSTYYAQADSWTSLRDENDNERIAMWRGDTSVHSATIPAGQCRVYAMGRPNFWWAYYNNYTNWGISTYITLSEPQYNGHYSCTSSELRWQTLQTNSEPMFGEKSTQYQNGTKEHCVWSAVSEGNHYYWGGNFSNTQFNPFNNKEIVYCSKTNGVWDTNTVYMLAIGSPDDCYVTFPLEKRLSNASGDSINPSVATNSDGSKVFVVWEDYRDGNGELFFNKSTDSGNSWLSAEVKIPVTSTGNCVTPAIACNPDRNTLYVIYADDESGAKELKVIKSTDGGATWTNPARITINSFDGSNAYKPSIACDASDAYVAWEDTRTGTSEIWFQKIPSNFAPLNGSTTTTMSMPQKKTGQGGIVILSGSSSLELLSPINGATVNDLRPTFSWYGLTGINNYKIECATSSDEASLNGSMGFYTATIADASGLKPLCSFTQDERFMGLDESDASRPYWYWRVEAIGTSEVATSEVASFTIELPATLADVTNWPNPFNPVRETTKMRYRLGRAADNVTIRIYDITGKLVRELDGTCYAEQGDVWHKYNDVEWDGRNGRGDMVLNGVYPFEVTVDYGSKTITARGKAVVLK